LRRRVPRHRGRFVDPIRNASTAEAAWRPSRIAHTMKDGCGDAHIRGLEYDPAGKRFGRG
jgi:hypothetical protein